ncbi:CDP-alcohol phosphatidyltransferase family protein [Halosimplex aquaticum]|uniref:CDP-alcohol phosphatidyltransferase family protein n=1 Tax=Halosimplex aquaticum TaxID=3026162 RepID=A0ABD5XVX5_9EURY|nr:CDP-alcohol phosphatidyltransferase family protein [Halosimplex aquaticum]
MTGSLLRAVRGAWRRVEQSDRVVHDASGRTNVLARLTGADYVSLTALFVGWGSTLLLLGGEPNLGLLAMFAGFGLDKLDGWWARRTGASSPFGRQIDSFIDVFVYLVPGALLFHVALAPAEVASLVVGFLVLSFGGLRLVRHNSEGFGSDGGTSFYHGTTVVHTNLVVVANYFLAAFVAPWNGWIAGVTIAAACPLMVSDYKAYKTDGSHMLAAIGVLVACGFAIGLHWGYM